MRGPHAFCPTSGASIDGEVYPTDDDVRAGQDYQYPLDDQHYGDGAHALTKGEDRSSRRALVNYFRRCHERHCDRDDQLYRRAALALKRLKGTEGLPRDVWVWYALGERLDRRGHEVEWMHVHCEVVCPHCGSRVKWERSPRGDIQPKCGVSCRGTDYVDGAVRDRIRSLFTAAFDPADPDAPLQFLEYRR